MHYRPKHFKAYEFVSEKVYNKWGETAFWFIDQGLLRDLDYLREYFNTSITINDWKWGGNYDASGLRQPGDEYFNPFSAHSFGKAIDIKVKGKKSFDVIEEIKYLKRKGKLKYITRLELGTNGWTHIDTFNAEPNDKDNNLFTFNPWEKI